MMRPDKDVLQADADRADLVVGKIESARDHVRDAILLLEEAAKLSPSAAEDCVESAEELRVVRHDFIEGAALFQAREAANRAHILVEDAYPNSDVGADLARALSTAA